MNNKRNNRGFTLVELLAVIAVLAIIISIAIPATISISNRSKEKMYKTKVEMIEKAAALYAQDNPNEYSNDVNNNCEIYVKDLVNSGYLKKEDDTKLIVNPKDNSTMKDYCINITKINNRFSATLGSTGNKTVVSSSSDDEYDMPVIISSSDGESNLAVLNSITVTDYDTDKPYYVKKTGSNSYSVDIGSASSIYIGATASKGSVNQADLGIYDGANLYNNKIIYIRVESDDNTNTETYSLTIIKSSNVSTISS